MATKKQTEYLRALMRGRTSSELNQLGMTQREMRGDFSRTSIERVNELTRKLLRYWG